MQIFSRASYLFFIIVVFVGQFACGDDEGEVDRLYPKIDTKDISQVDATGALVRGTVVQLGPDPIIDHGFVYGLNNTSDPLEIGAADQVSLGPKSAVGDFDALLFDGLVEGFIYRVRSYVTTASFTVYGQQKTFTSASTSEITLDDFTPKQGVIGDTITISGFPLDRFGVQTRVFIGDFEAQIISNTQETITSILPESTPGGDVSIRVDVGGIGATFLETYNVLSPEIASVSPGDVTFGDKIVILGNNFSRVPEFNRVEVLGLVDLRPVNSNTSERLEIIIPNNITKTSDRINLIVGSQQTRSQDSVKLLNGKIEDFNPKSGLPSSLVSLIGSNFSELPAYNNIWLGDVKLDIIAASPGNITIVVPEDIPAGTYNFSYSLLDLPRDTTLQTFEVLPE